MTIFKMRLSTLVVTGRDATWVLVRGAVGRAAALGVVVVALVVAFVVVVVAVAAGRVDAAPREPRRLDDLQWLGTHNSYHVRPDRTITPGEPADYGHAPLGVQLSEQGIRSFELDAWNGPDFPVFHSLIIDTGSTCPTLDACFRTIKRWSNDHPEHQPLALFVEAKVLPTSTNPSVQSATDAAAAELGITSWDAAGFDRLDALVRKSFGGKLITPDDVRGKRRTLRDAVVRDGWPTAATSRGKVFVTLIGAPAELDLYRSGAPLLKGRAMFANARPTDPSAAVISRDVPDARSGIPRLVRNHFIVKTRADANGVEARANDRARADAALASGAQIIVTDYPVPDPAVGPYAVSLNG